MAKCLLGAKKLRKISAIVGDKYEVHCAMVRGGWDHFDAVAFLKDKETGAKPTASVNYKTGEWSLIEGMFSTWV